MRFYVKRTVMLFPLTQEMIYMQTVYSLNLVDFFMSRESVLQVNKSIMTSWNDVSQL